MAFSPPCNDAVAVQLTPIIPVRVFSAAGEYFDTEMHLDTPLEVLQLAIEDYFKIKPEAQRLLHNRKAVNPKYSLQQSGCLLLKGDPYVKLTCHVKRGPLLNLVCQLSSTHEVVAVACDEQCTVWEAKQAVLEEMRRKGHAWDRRIEPGQMRLLWRYIELNDKATLAYYRIPTNAVLSVMLRRGATVSVRAAAASSCGAHPSSAPAPSPVHSAAYSQRGRLRDTAAAGAAPDRRHVEPLFNKETSAPSPYGPSSTLSWPPPALAPMPVSGTPMPHSGTPMPVSGTPMPVSGVPIGRTAVPQAPPLYPSPPIVVGRPSCTPTSAADFRSTGGYVTTEHHALCTLRRIEELESSVDRLQRLLERVAREMTS